MKKIAKISLMLLLALGIGFSCTKNFEEMNTSPNSPTDVPAISIFTSVCVSGPTNWLGGWIQHTYLGCWSQQWTKIQYIDEDKYQVRPSDMDGFFNSHYSGCLKNLKIIKDKTADYATTTTDFRDDALYAAAMVLTAWNYSQLTDVFGDVPYFHAIEGFSATGDLTPAYDPQELIYKSIIDTVLVKANEILANSIENFGAGDVLYGGDPAKWRKFSNSLRLRLLNRASDAWPEADTRIQAMLADPGTWPIMESNDDNCKLVFPGEAPYKNPIYNTLFSRTDQGISQTAVDFMKLRTDPRLPVFAQPRAEDGDYVGQQNGAARQPPMAKRSLLGVAVAYTANAPLNILQYAEVKFYIAEYMARKNQNAKAVYEEAIRASLDYWGVGGSADAYLAGEHVAYDQAKAIELITEQKWIAIFGQGVEAFAEIRRTHTPARIFQYELEATVFPGRGLPVRMAYSTAEESYNGKNLIEAKTRQGIESIDGSMFGARVWWDTKMQPVPTVKDPQKDY
ncbi:MAG: SusD/RagB family nutrient-binding outer membrane lipoprotein [Bacteroidales bacterium]